MSEVVRHEERHPPEPSLVADSRREGKRLHLARAIGNPLEITQRVTRGPEIESRVDRRLYRLAGLGSLGRGESEGREGAGGVGRPSLRQVEAKAKRSRPGRLPSRRRSGPLTNF